MSEMTINWLGIRILTGDGHTIVFDKYVFYLFSASCLVSFLYGLFSETTIWPILLLMVFGFDLLILHFVQVDDHYNLLEVLYRWWVKGEELK